MVVYLACIQHYTCNARGIDGHLRSIAYRDVGLFIVDLCCRGHLVGFETIPFIWVVARLSLAIWLMTTALGGVDRAPLPLWSRILRISFGIGALLTITEVQIIAFMAGLALIIIEGRRVKTVRDTSSSDKMA